MLSKVALKLLKQLGFGKVKTCSKCKETKLLSSFEPHSKYSDGYRGQCRDCRVQDHKDYYKKNAGLIKIKTAILQIKNPREYWVYSTICGHKKRGCTILFDKQELIKLAHATYTCKVCGCELAWERRNKNGSPLSNSPTLDRINQNKVLTINDVQIICSRCNVTKNARSMEEFKEYCKHIASINIGV